MRAPAGHVLSVVDSHTCGQPTRVIVGGLPDVAGATPAEARELLRQEHDWVRRLAVLEPRGRRALFGVALLYPTEAGAPFGVVFMDAAGYPNMCGHATIGVVTTLIEAGYLDAPQGESSFVLQTPGGPITIRAVVAGECVESVTFVNQPAYQTEILEIDEPSGSSAVPIAYGGQWYAFVNARDFGLSVELERAPDLVEMAETLRPAIAHAVTCTDPGTGVPPLVENVMWVDEPRVAGADGLNMAVNVAGAFDRSPCGTGTSARLAVLSSAGALQPGESYVNSGVLGTVYRGTIAARTEVGGTAAIVPEITGRAWLTGRAELWASDDDPLADGVLL